MQADNEIKIEVTEPEINQTENYVTYLITGTDKNGEYTVRRRYNDFYLLRQVLVERWPGMYVPPISSKKATGNKEEKFVEERKRFLDYFCVKIAERPYMFYSQQFQLFLKGNINLQKSLKQLPPVNYKQKSQTYQKYFQKSADKLTSAQILIMNQTDYEYLKKTQKKYENIREEFKAVADAKKIYANQFVHIFHDVLPEYEEKFLLHHVGKQREKLIISKEPVKVQIKQYQALANHNPLEDYVQMVSYELRQARAFIEAVESRKKIEQVKMRMQRRRIDSKQQLDKLQAGKSSLRSFFSSGNKQQQIQKLQKQIQKLNQDIQSLDNLIQLMNAACHQQISSYKTKRGKQYVNLLKEVAQKQIKELASYGHILKVPLNEYAK